MANFSLLYSFFIIIKVLPFCALSYIVFKNDLRFSYKTSFYSITSFWILIFIFNFISIYLDPYNYDLINSLLIVLSVLSIIIWIIFFKSPFFKKLYSLCLLGNMGAFYYGIINFIQSTLFGYDNAYYYGIKNMYISIFAFIFLFPLLSYMYIKSFNEDLPGVYNVAWIFPFFSLIILINCNLAFNPETIYSFDYLIYFLFLFSALVSFYFLIKQISSICLENEKLRTSEIYNKLTLSNYSTIQDRISLLTAERHESNHRLLVIKTLCTEKDYNHLERYINNLINNSALSEPIIYTKNPIVNSILCDRLSIAKHHNINVNYDVNVPEYIPIYIDDLCSLLMNILDNSIEACKTINNETTPYIKFKIFVDNNVLFISCINSKINSIKCKNGIFITSKKDKHNHGIGTTIIDNIVKKYNGFKNVQYNGDTFTIKAYLKLKNSKEMIL